MAEPTYPGILVINGQERGKMASASSIMKHGFHGVIEGVNESHGLTGIGGLFLDGAIVGGTSYAIGQVYHRKRKVWWGKHAPTIAAVTGKVVAAIAAFVTGGEPNLVSGAFNAVGNAGIGAIGLEYGLRHARKATGVRAVLKSANGQLGPGEEETALGNLRNGGRGMKWAQIEQMAAAH